MFRSIVAIVLSVVIWGGLWSGTAQLLPDFMSDGFNADKVPTTNGARAALIAVSFALSILAGLVCGMITRRMKVVWILAVIQLAIGIAVQMAYRESYPLWYHAAFLALVIPGHLIGGRLGVGERR